MDGSDERDFQTYKQLLAAAAMLRRRYGLYDVDECDAVSHGWEALHQLELDGGKDKAGRTVLSPIAYATTTMNRWFARQIGRRVRSRRLERPLPEDLADPSDQSRFSEAVEEPAEDPELDRNLRAKLEEVLSALPAEKAEVYRHVLRERYASDRALNEIWENDIKEWTSLSRSTVYRLVADVSDRLRPLLKRGKTP